MDGNAPAFQYFNQLQLSILLSFNLIFTLINLQNLFNKLLGLLIIKDIVIGIDFIQVTLDQIIDESLPVNI